MSLKKLFGLEDFPISEAEIMEKIEEAHHNRRHEVIFTSGGRKVRLSLSGVHPEGIMRGYTSYYSG